MSEVNYEATIKKATEKSHNVFIQVDDKGSIKLINGKPIVGLQHLKRGKNADSLDGAMLAFLKKRKIDPTSDRAKKILREAGIMEDTKDKTTGVKGWVSLPKATHIIDLENSVVVPVKAPIKEKG